MINNTTTSTLPRFNYTTRSSSFFVDTESCVLPRFSELEDSDVTLCDYDSFNLCQTDQADFNEQSRSFESKSHFDDQTSRNNYTYNSSLEEVSKLDDFTVVNLCQEFTQHVQIEAEPLQLLNEQLIFKKPEVLIPNKIETIIDTFQAENSIKIQAENSIKIQAEISSKINSAERTQKSWRTPKKIKKEQSKKIRGSIRLIVPVRVQINLEPPSTPLLKGQDVPMTNISEKNAHEQMKNSAKSFKCPHCELIYKDARALGGHASKKHVGMSKAYNRKIGVRQQRSPHRIALSLAKMLFEKHSQSSITQERTVVTKIRSVIMETRPEVLKLGHSSEQEPVEGWFSDLVAELLDGRHGHITAFKRLLSLTAINKAPISSL